MLKHRRNLFWPLLLALCLCETVSAFQATSLRVSVFDQASAQIPGAAVSLKRGSRVVAEVKPADAQPAVFSRLEPGQYLLEVRAAGFRAYAGEVNVKAGANEASVVLEVDGIEENIEVRPGTLDQVLDPREGALTNFLTREQIDALPDDPKEMERALRQIAGENAVIRVDGFTGGQLPPKSQISSIKIIRSTFDAEFHEAGFPLVDIITKAGGSRWGGALAFRFNDESLNARQAFAAARRPSQLRSFDGFVNGPVIRNKTSLTAFAFGNSSYDTRTIVAALPGGPLNETAQRTSDFLYTSIKVVHNLSKTHSLNAAFNHNRNRAGNLGVGGFNLPSRAYDSEISTSQGRLSVSGYVGDNFLHEFRLQFTDEAAGRTPLSGEPAVVVLDAFSGGGAGVDGDQRRRSLWVSENLLFGVGRHALKVGGLIEHDRLRLETAENANGTFTFSSLDDYVQNRPATFTQRQTPRRIDFSQTRVGVFLQDDIRLHKTVSLSLGVRYERQSDLEDGNNFSPRLGFVWAPERRGRLTFRGGVGVFYTWLNPSDLGTILSQDESQGGETIVVNPGFINPALVGAADSLPQSFWTLAPDIKSPYLIPAMLGVETRVGRNLTLRALYNFQRGVRQFRSRDVNAPLPGAGRPDPTRGRITQTESSGFFVRNSLNVSASGNLAKRVSFTVDYTLAKAVSDAEGIFSLPLNSYDLSLDRSVSNADQRHRFYAFSNWNIRRGLNFSTIFKVGSPLPYTLTTGRDDNGDAIFNDRPSGVGRNSLRGDWQKQVDVSLGWTVFFGSRKNPASGPQTIILTGSEASAGGFELDPTKKFALKFYASAANILNQTNLRNFVGVQTSPFFGRAISADSPRQIEAGVRLNF
ncbi:MAG TPA: TonB-dependent receptor [Pyrinomonadaceae bacterium]|nr:TonB-dependent receptor [Pyrinomonadaceae bacterium]